ncbi:MAG: hypothetical protein ACI9XK_004894 [Granulosicoccus sp.]|jgi:hypothetical protein
MPTLNVNPTEVPDDSLLAQYRIESTGKVANNYCDCYSIVVNRKIDLDEFVYAFYTSTIFRFERKILAIVLGIPSTDENAKQLSLGQADCFSAWTVETRLDNEILLWVRKSRTGSWFMVRENEEPVAGGTELLFGSVVLPGKDQKGFGILFHSLMGFHKLYSKALLYSAKKRLTVLQDN